MNRPVLAGALLTRCLVEVSDRGVHGADQGKADSSASGDCEKWSAHRSQAASMHCCKRTRTMPQSVRRDTRERVPINEVTTKARGARWWFRGEGRGVCDTKARKESACQQLQT